MKLHCPHCGVLLGINTYGVKLHRKIQANERKFICRECCQEYGHTFLDERSQFGMIYYWIRRLGSNIRRVILWK